MASSRRERRSHRRYDSQGPVSLVDAEGRRFHGAYMKNVSEGGLFFTTPIHSLPAFGSDLEVVFTIPRSTPNTRMIEEFIAKAKVTRHQPMVDGNHAGVALQFHQPVELMLDV